MHVVNTLNVRTLASDPELLTEFMLNAPQSNSGSATYALKIAGWIVGRVSSIELLEIIADGQILKTVPVQIPRPDVAARLPTAPGSDHCGFWALVGVLGLRPQFTITLQAVFSDQTRLPVAEIQCSYNSVDSHFEPTLRPLMVTSLGRTGTTWLMRLLSEHPQVAVYRRYPYEFRFARYWMHVLAILSAPADHHQSSHPDTFQSNHCFVGHNPFFTGHVAETDSLGKWLGQSHVEELAAFSQRSIEDCYKQIAQDQGQNEPVYFAEKHLPDHLPWTMLQLYRGVREIILVRDFRDMICSVLAFNLKRGYASFGRARTESDADFVRQVGSGVLRLKQAWEERSESAHLVRYEDVVLEPLPTLRKIFKYLELECSAPVLEGIVDRASQESTELARHKTTSNPRASINRWKSDLNPDLINVCNDVFKEALQAFGYADS